jgi:hypothetical protein
MLSITHIKYIIIIIIIYLIYNYAYYSGSCQRNFISNKDYICNKHFCLYKEFKIILNDIIHNEINIMISNNTLQKRVTISTYIETIFNCAIPNKSGTTIPTQNITKYAPKLIDYYKNELCNIVSNKLKIKLYPTDLNLPTSCAILIYDKEGDWINWHYDYNYYNGRFFTVLIPITNEETCTFFQFRDNNNNTKNINLINNNSVCFEGNYLYHRATKLCNNQRRILLSCQYVTDNTMNFINKIRIKLKDYAYIGKLI